MSFLPNHRAFPLEQYFKAFGHKNRKSDQKALNIGEKEPYKAVNLWYFVDFYSFYVLYCGFFKHCLAFCNLKMASLRHYEKVRLLRSNGTARFKKCKQLFVYSYLETSGGIICNPYFNVVHFFNTRVN
jgi:hypothetical protein